MKTYTRDNKTYIETRSNTPNSKQKRIRKKKEEENNNNSRIIVTVDVNRSIFSFFKYDFIYVFTNQPFNKRKNPNRITFPADGNIF